jgi:hypothetical protein
VRRDVQLVHDRFGLTDQPYATCHATNIKPWDN